MAALHHHTTVKD